MAAPCRNLSSHWCTATRMLLVEIAVWSLTIKAVSKPFPGRAAKQGRVLRCCFVLRMCFKDAAFTQNINWLCTQVTEPEHKVLTLGGQGVIQPQLQVSEHLLLCTAFWLCWFWLRRVKSALFQGTRDTFAEQCIGTHAVVVGVLHSWAFRLVTFSIMSSYLRG